LVHELAHAAGKKGTFSHLALDAAARAADPDLSFGPLYTPPALNSSGDRDSADYFDAFLLKHCDLGFEGQQQKKP
jgi:hypothetical protein